MPWRFGPNFADVGTVIANSMRGVPRGAAAPAVGETNVEVDADGDIAIEMLSG